MTYEARLTVQWNTPSGPRWDFRSSWSTVYPNDQPVAWFYEHINYSGNATFAQSGVAWVGDSWNDTISSVRVPAGKTVELFQHINFGGQSLVLTSDAPDLRAFPGPGQNGTWNDCVSSFRIY